MPTNLKLNLGEHLAIDQISQQGKIEINLKTMLRHTMALGSSGSGKTVLCKVLVEEIIKQKIPAICLDPQGDLCSLALGLNDEETLKSKGISLEDAKAFQEQVEVVIFTPAARKGVPLCADPFFENPSEFEGAEKIQMIANTASMLCALLGYDLASDDGSGLDAVFNHFLTQLDQVGKYPKALGQFASYIDTLDESQRDEASRFLEIKKLDAAKRKLARLDVGTSRFLFHDGIPLSIDFLLGKDPRAKLTEGKTRLSIIYLNTLNTSEDKDFLISAIVDQLYAWMLKNPNPNPQALFYIDEVAPYIPPVKKPACKQGLSLLFKQARKYGVCCLMATQNPGDVDYKAMAQFGTWAIGRLTTKQDINKVLPTIKSIDPTNADLIVSKLPGLKAGEFVLLSADEFKSAVFLKARWLYGHHKTLDDQAIADIHDQTWGDTFLKIEKSIKQVSDQLISNNPPKAKAETKTEAKTETKSEIKSEAKVELDFSDIADQEQKQKALLIFQRNASLTAQEFASESALSLDQSKKLLEKLKTTGALKSWEKGRSTRYFSVSAQGRPDIDLPNPIEAIVPRIKDLLEVKSITEKLSSKGLMGMFSSADPVIQQDLVYKVLLKISFSQMVERGFFEKWVLQKGDGKQNGNIYLDPRTLYIIAYQPHSQIQYLEKLESYAVDLQDFDGNVQFEKIGPAGIQFDEQAWIDRQSDAKIEKALEKQLNAKLIKIEAVFLPYWRTIFQSGKTLSFDALTGQILA
jgi:hypothetical protein